MSLQLRKQCQAMLDNVGLNNYHVQIADDTKYMQIVGECGQPFVTIQGIRFSKMAPTQLEIDISLELFDAFLVKHTATFKAFIKAKAIADAFTVPEAPVEIFPGARVQKQPYGNREWQLLLPTVSFYHNERNPLVVTVKGKCEFPSVPLNFIESTVKELQPGFTVKEIKAIKAWCQKCSAYVEACNTYKRLSEQLNSCEI